MPVEALVTIFINAGLLAMAAIAAVISLKAVNDARTARDDAAEHERRALKAAESSAGAASRSASALEEQAQIMRENTPQKKVVWTVRLVRNALHEATNTGDGVATEALLTNAGPEGFIRPTEDAPRAVPPGDGLAFHLLRAGGVTPKLRIDWVENGEPHSAELAMH